MPKQNFIEVETIDITPENADSFEQLIDIRTPDEWRETGVIKGAKRIYLYDNDWILNPKFLDEILSAVDTKKPVALVCKRGVRSLNAAEFLASSGAFSRIINLNGGMLKFLNEGYKPEF